jgi:mRNA-degrading endonuclease RelE of RelBE toxin-antitoxin system
MSYKILPTPRFEKDVKRLLKKHPSIKKDLADLINQIAENPTLGIPIGHDCFKIRLSIASKGKGKSGGGRVITYVYYKDKTVYLLSIYDKSEQDSISDSEIINYINHIE